jgi:hypothetical protein
MLQIGDRVVTMSYLGIFTVVDIRGDDVTIAGEDGSRKVVRLTNVRRLNPPAEAER